MEHSEEVLEFWRGWCERIYKFILTRWRICYEYTEQLTGKDQEAFGVFMQVMKGLDDAQRQLLVRVYFQGVTIRETKRSKSTKRHTLLVSNPMYCYTQEEDSRALIA